MPGPWKASHPAAIGASDAACCHYKRRLTAEAARFAAPQPRSGPCTDRRKRVFSRSIGPNSPRPIFASDRTNLLRPWRELRKNGTRRCVRSAPSIARRGGRRVRRAGEPPCPSVGFHRASAFGGYTPRLASPSRRTGQVGSFAFAASSVAQSEQAGFSPRAHGSNLEARRAGSASQ
jgi:hypothetical protein